MSIIHPLDVYLILLWDETSLSIDTSACEQKIGIDSHIGVAKSRSAIVSALLEGFLLARLCSQSKIENTISDLAGNATKERGVLLWVGIACVDGTVIAHVSWWELIRRARVGRRHSVQLSVLDLYGKEYLWSWWKRSLKFGKLMRIICTLNCIVLYGILRVTPCTPKSALSCTSVSIYAWS